MHHIVIGTDLTEESRHSFQAGLALAKDLGAAIRLVHALPVQSTGLGLAGVPGQSESEIASDAVDTARKLTNEWLVKARAEGIEAEGVVESADPAALLLDSSKGARMIVVGSHQRSGAARFFLGSVSEAVLRKAQCPVLVVPIPDA